MTTIALALIGATVVLTVVWVQAQITRLVVEHAIRDLLAEPAVHAGPDGR